LAEGAAKEEGKLGTLSLTVGSLSLAAYSRSMDATSVLLFCCFVALVLLLLRQSPAASQNNSDSRKQPQRGPSKRIADNYRSLRQVEAALRRAGLESSDLIVAVDFTKSNQWQGERSFRGRSLHALSAEPGVLNPYQQVIETIASVLVRRLDDDSEVPLYGFGDIETQNKFVFELNNGAPCRSKEELLQAYADAAANVKLSGPTSFSPIIREAIDICRSTGRYHILLIIADGLMDDVDETIRAIVDASKHPLSIVMVGVGDGPWDTMETFDDDLPNEFDNFQFCNFTSLLESHRDPQQRAVQFALDALMELPDQYKIIKERGLLSKRPDASVRFPFRLRGKHHFPRNAAASSIGGGTEGIEAAPGGPPGGLPSSPNPPAYAPRF